MDIIKVRVEKNESGEYWANTLDTNVIVVADGNDMDELKSNLFEAFRFAVEDLPNVDDYSKTKFEYLMDIESFFKMIPSVKIGKIAEKAKINPSLMRQYATGKAYVSEVRLKEIERTVHDLAKDLLSIRF